MEFFCSYARDDENGSDLMQEFFEDLCNDVRGRTGMRIDRNKSCLEQPDPLGFVDQIAVELGEKWPQRLTEALNSCKVMVSLYSPSYFQRHYCGKEFGYFLERIRNHRENHPELKEDPAVILPVLWLPCDEYIPKEITVRNYFQYGQPKEYTLNGLKYMIQLQENRVAYNKIVQKIGEQIVKAAKVKIDPLPQPLDMELVPAAFAQPEPTVAQASEPAREGPNTVRFVYVVGTQREFKKYKVRSTLTPYADDLRPFWAPFPPPEGKESLRNAIGITTMGFVSEIKRMLPLTLDLDQNLIVEIRQAKEKNSLVVLLIDTWSLKIQPYQDLMRIYDDTNFLNCAALVIWDGSDETGKSAKDLESLVARIFDDNYKTRLPRLFMPKVATLNDFLTNIDSVLETLRSNVMTTGEPMNPLPPGGRELPRIRNG